MIENESIPDDGEELEDHIGDDGDSFIIEDDEGDGFRDITLPPTVASLLRLRSELEEGSPTSLQASSRVARVPTKFEAAALTDSRKIFDYNLINAQLPPLDAIGIETYLDLKDYDMTFKEHAERPLGGLRLIYAFYSRLYSKLINYQKGIKIPFFTPPVPTESRTFGFREIIDFQQDFKLTQVVGRRDLESIFIGICGLPTQDETFRTGNGMTFDQFLDFIALVALTDDRHCLPGETQLQRISRFIRKHRLHKGVEVKMALHNIWRDRHFWRLRDDSDFEKEARLNALKVVPIYKVRSLRPRLRYRKPGWSSFRKYLSQFEWLDTGPVWEKFDGPFVDMGTSLVGQTKKFKIILRNLRYHVMRFNFEICDVGPIRLPIPDVALDGLGPGQDCTVPIEPFVNDEGEYTGRIRITATTSAGEIYPFEIPVYMCARFPHEGEGPTGRELPLRAPQPFQSPPAELTCPQVTESDDKKGTIHSVCVGVSTPTYRTFYVDVCSNSNLNPRKPRLYGHPTSAPPNRPRSAPPTRAVGGPPRPTTAPVLRTMLETPRVPQQRPQSAHVAAARPWSSKQRQLTNPEAKTPVRQTALNTTIRCSTPQKVQPTHTERVPVSGSGGKQRPFSSGSLHRKRGQMIPTLQLQKKRPSSAQVHQMTPGLRSHRPQSAMSRIDAVQWPAY